MPINRLKEFLWLASLVLIVWPANLYAEDIDRWANIESWEGNFSVYYRHGSYTNSQYRGTINLDEKRIYKRRRQTEWKSVRWKGELKASGNYRMEMNLPELEMRMLEQASGPVSDRASLKINKRNGTYSLAVSFSVQATQRTWYKGSLAGTEKKLISITSPLLPQPLPKGGLVLEGSATFSGDILPAVGTMAGGMPSGGMEFPDWGVSWQLWPKGSNPEPTLEFVEGGKDWIPEDDNTVEAVLKWDENFVPSEVRFTLYDISEEPGISLNSRDKNTDPDIEFDEKNKSLKYEITQSGETSVATKDELPFNEEKIIIHAKDFGAYSKLKAEVKVAGSWFVATAKSLELPYLPVPYDKNENKIADKWEKEVGVYNRNLSPNWDEDPNPQSQKSYGDGFTLYEEYRGFQEIGHVFKKGDHEQVKDGHVRMDPMYKDVFIVDWDGLFAKFYKPYNPANLNWHIIDRSMMKGTGSLWENPDFRWVNFNTSKKHFFRNQYAVFITNKGKSSNTELGNDVGYAPILASCSKPMRYSRPLKCIYSAEIYLDTINAWADKAPGTSEDKDKYASDQATSTVIHELGHAIGIAHHKPDSAEGAKNCSIRYDSSTETGHPRLFGFLRTQYCKEGDIYITDEADDSGEFKRFSGHNCYGQINIKGD